MARDTISNLYSTMDARVQQTIAAAIIRRRRAIIVAAVVTAFKRRRVLEQRKRRWWSRKWVLRPDTGQNVLNMVFGKLGPDDPASFTNYTRMLEDERNELLTLLTPLRKKQDTVMRQAISPRARPTVTLRYLATSNTFQDLSYSARIAPNTISKVIDETLSAIVLDSKVWNFLSTPEGWQVIAHKFDTLWNFPHCINYKRKYSIVLLGLVEAEYRFLFVDVGRNGRMHDSTVLRESPFWTKINDGTLNLPAPREIPGSS